MESDAEIIRNYLSGDDKALDSLLARHINSVYAFVYRLIGDRAAAEDVTQDVFYKVWRNLPRFNEKKSFKTWLFTIAHNTAIDWLRKRRNIPFSVLNREEEIFEEGIIDESPLPDELYARAELGELLEAALGQLSHDYRAVIVLRHADELTFEEISEVLGKPLNTIKSQYRRALMKLSLILRNAPK